MLWSDNQPLRGQVGATETLLENSADPLTPATLCGMDTPTSVPNNTYGYGSLNVLAAFNLIPNTPPNPASNPIPAQSAVDVSLTPTFNWAGGDPDGNGVSYDVYLEANANPPAQKVAAHLTAASFAPGGLLPGEVYFWQVITTDTHAGTTSGPVWSFTTLSTRVHLYLPAVHR